MSEVWKIVLTAALTVVGGTIVYTVGHFLVALFVEPIHRLRSLIGEIADSLIFYADVYSNPGSASIARMDDTSKVLRRRASQLMARVHLISWYSFWAFTRLVRKKTEIEDAHKELIGLSNSIHRSEPRLGIENDERRRKIEKLLGIK